ncbi:MAG: UPF0158 family protein [Zoogloeaceae bacterium]|jgi:hypothetical protein|nr:UPF0158 family protein [Zoogloeaceae bacterium]
MNLSPPPVFLEDIAEHLQMANDGFYQFLHRQTGELFECDREYWELAEAAQDKNERQGNGWEDEMIADALRVQAHLDDYVALPAQADIHEYNIMESFADQVADAQQQAYLYNALRGKGAFRRFKDALTQLDLREAWFAWYFEACLEIARKWCEDNKIAYTGRDRKP